MELVQDLGEIASSEELAAPDHRARTSIDRGVDLPPRLLGPGLVADGDVFSLAQGADHLHIGPRTRRVLGEQRGDRGVQRKRGRSGPQGGVGPCVDLGAEEGERSRVKDHEQSQPEEYPDHRMAVPEELVGARTHPSSASVFRFFFGHVAPHTK
ncbi:MAG: hypothetical protein AAGA56_21850 [Myxococcota bacterium]